MSQTSQGCCLKGSVSSCVRQTSSHETAVQHEHRWGPCRSEAPPDTISVAQESASGKLAYSGRGGGLRGWRGTLPVRMGLRPRGGSCADAARVAILPADLRAHLTQPWTCSSIHGGRDGAGLCAAIACGRYMQHTLHILELADRMSQSGVFLTWTRDSKQAK